MSEQAPRARERELRKARIRRRRLIVVGGLVGVFITVLTGIVVATATPHRQASAKPGTTPTPPVASTLPVASTPPAPTTPTAPPEVAFDRSTHSLDDTTSIWVVVNKTRPLNPLMFVPSDLVDVPVPHTWAPQLRKEASDAVVTMFSAATSEAQLTLASNSAYRSYSAQQSVYTGDDTTTARPGFSEHQTGLAIDIGAKSGICSLSVCFAQTKEGIWLRDNAWKYGFILRYPADKTLITGYSYEPWHFRYVGVALSTQMHNTATETLEEFFELPAAPDYR
ncbi:MAG: hypothetical protein B5766_00610 [Candidatus Lumbricidophila eiseniae]|uniref:D-alanyl-D-alanine carboxypeptidase-like core domain-containing protein n=1 Tax=Candidatus Lumbricidiphila eiseniae TaxID=1969409 RepID=A0A2A6FV09_9MICO|nr:MAG: hypothetical protein B5766_00610 [Candidatus Lumbricidophila eiseniae]